MAPFFHSKKAMNRKSRILYIQHADSIGGSVISLKEIVIDALATGYECTVICMNTDVAKIYQELGAQTLISLISPWNHNTALHYKLNLRGILKTIKVFLKTLASFIALAKTIKNIKPDIVHLNSSNLILYNIYFKFLSKPTIFHVRECIVTGNFGIRKNLIRKIANATATYVIYISEAEYGRLGTDPVKSFVIYNYVHEHSFLSESNRREKRASSSKKFRLITLGGLFSLKGGKIIVEAIRNCQQEVLLMVLGGTDPRIDKTEIERIDGQEYVEELIEVLNSIEPDTIEFYGRVKNSGPFIREADALLFWAASPHFPRPVFESWLLRKPVLYFNPNFPSSKITSKNVFPVPEGTPQALADAIAAFRKSNLFSIDEVTQSYQLARGHFTEPNFQKINQLYRSCLN
jgi:glycosyltransferase involved in cell wall biosynthesis